jgi:hypothetical protein
MYGTATTAAGVSAGAALDAEANTLGFMKPFRLGSRARDESGAAGLHAGQVRD